MQSIITVFKDGTRRDQLSVIADVLSIFGVSFLAIGSSIFALKDRLFIGNVVFAVVLSLFSFASVSLIFAVFLEISARISNMRPDNRRCIWPFQIALWAVFTGFFILGTFLLYDYLSGYRFTKS